MTRLPILAALILTGCTNHDCVFGAAFMTGLCVGALLTAIMVLLIDWSER